ncbi:MAG: diacylglycerol kinase family lipid kinase [Tidjanibacter sp.]|nr:diacylglycerol kinase family lipid kinase [Tidjanibacter sp.]
MQLKERWLAIVNLLSGSGKCSRDWAEIAKILTDSGIEFDSVVTEHCRHAIELARNAVESGYRRIISVGGDGTAHEIANGILSQTVVEPSEVTLGVISVGTGNDWTRMYGIQNDYRSCVEVLREGHTMLQDVGVATFRNRAGESESRYFINISGVGMDAAVNLSVCQMKDKGRNGKLSYMSCLAKSVFSYHSTKMKITVDGKSLTSAPKVMSATVGIGQYNGGGMRQVPNAKTDDGLYDLTVIDAMSPLKIATSMKNLYDGTIYSLRKVNRHVGCNIEIESTPAIEMEVDGEPLGTTPVSYRLIDRALRISVPKEYGVVE